ncbi:hypothetical protein EDB92DRAFT_1914081, partial [Lactarius akahatsu]
TTSMPIQLLALHLSLSQPALAEVPAVVEVQTCRTHSGGGECVARRTHVEVVQPGDLFGVGVMELRDTHLVGLGDLPEALFSRSPVRRVGREKRQQKV